MEVNSAALMQIRVCNYHCVALRKGRELELQWHEAVISAGRAHRLAQRVPRGRAPEEDRVGAVPAAAQRSVTAGRCAGLGPLPSARGAHARAGSIVPRRERGRQRQGARGGRAERRGVSRSGAPSDESRPWRV